MTTPNQEPQMGGSYVRQPDGSLERVAATEPAPMRDKREPDSAASTPPADAPAAGAQE